MRAFQYFISLLASLWQLCNVNARSLLVLGDSVDRLMCADWCELRGVTKQRCGGAGSHKECSHWMADVLKHEVYPPSMTSMLCNVSHDTIAFVHLYGSPETGPYFKFGASGKNGSDSYNVSRRDKYTASPARIAIAIKSHFNRLGAPDTVVLNSALWDIARLYESQGLMNSTLGVRDKGYLTRHGELDRLYSPAYNSSCEKFERDFRNRIRDVEIGLALNMGLPYLVGDGVKGGLKGGVKVNATTLRRVRNRIALRTSVWNSANNLLTHAFNNITRSLCDEMQLSFYDYDKDLWEGVGYNRSLEKELFRDFIHPLKHFTAAAGEKMLLNAYSSLYFPRYIGEEIPSVPRPWWRALGKGNTTTRPSRMMRVHVVSEAPKGVIDKHSTFYVKSVESTREVVELFVGVTKDFLRTMDLGPSDVLYLPPALMASIPKGPPLPREFTLEAINRSCLAEAINKWVSDPTRPAHSNS